MNNSKLMQHDVSTNEQVEQSESVKGKLIGYTMQSELDSAEYQSNIVWVHKERKSDAWNIPLFTHAPNTSTRISQLEADKAELLLALRVSNGWLDSYISKSLVSRLVKDNKELIAKHKGVK